MNIKDFVSESLRQICQGIVEAQKKGVNRAGSVSKDIKFDIAVTVSEGQESGGKAGISVWSVGANIQGKSEASSSTVSRIQFVVPIFYPDKSENIS